MATCPKCGTRYASNVKICTHDGTVLNDEPAADPHIGKLLDGKYRLDSYLSQGGMGAVYKATHVMLDKTLVVKLIKPELVTSAEIVRRFQREARAASNLNHPNIVQVFDLGQTDDGTLYIAMEFIDGPSLKDVIRKTGSMPVARIKLILGQVASALSNAHAHNIIHRDLKPHNVMLARASDGREVAKLLDFGIAKTFEDGGTQLTQTGFAIGTPQYMAPEQAAGKEVTPQSDLYSLGVMLYEMLVGEVPFDAPTTAAILIKQLTESPQPPSRRRPELGISEVLEAITMRCLDKEPVNRFATAEAFAEALKNADSDATQRRASEASTRGMPVPSRAATTLGGPVAAPQATAATHVAPPPADVMPPAPAPTRPAPVPIVVSSPPAAAAMAPPPVAAPPPVLAAPLLVASPPNEGTRPTVPGAMPVAKVPPPPASSSRTGLWITLGAVAVLVLAVGALQLGLIPGQHDNSSSTPQAQSTPAPQASPASADAPPAATPAAAPSPAAPATPFRAESAQPSPAPSQGAGRTAEAVPAPSPSAAPSQARASAANPASGASRPAPASNAAPAAAPSTPAPVPAVTPAAASPARAPQPAPAPSAAAPPAAAAPAQAARPENLTVFLRCEGFPAICNALRASLLEQFQKHNIQPVREPNRAAIVLTGNVEVVQERVSREFGQPMQTRTYTVDVSGETRDGNPVSMPAPRTFSFDAQFGRERLDENARVIASDVTDKIRAFWNK